MEEVGMRDHCKLQAFSLADALALQVYEATRYFPDHEKYGLTAQMRRAAVSTGANIVEGAARGTTGDYVRFLRMAYGSACELEYEISIAVRLGYLRGHPRGNLELLASRTCKALRGLVNAVSPG
jgi:four helix bundle protein